MKKLLIILLVSLIITACNEEINQQIEVSPKTWLVSPVATPTPTSTVQPKPTPIPWTPVSIDWCKLVATCQ